MFPFGDVVRKDGGDIVQDDVQVCCRNIGAPMQKRSTAVTMRFP